MIVLRWAETGAAWVLLSPWALGALAAGALVLGLVSGRLSAGSPSAASMCCSACCCWMGRFRSRKRRRV